MKIDIIREMKMVAMVLILPMTVLAVTVEPLPPSEFADTEVSTNISFAVDRSMMTRIEFTVALDATPTNNVEVAIGTDGNGDGNLSVEESAYVFGWDCGRWFKRERDRESGIKDQGLEAPAGESAGGTVLIGTECPTLSAKTFVLRKRKLDTAWDLVKVTRRGCGAVCELVKAEGRKPGFKLEVR